MENMPINLHFFSSTAKGRINYTTLLDYFQELPNFDIYYDNEVCDIIYTDNDFGFQYEFKITKGSQINDIYKLNPAYLNINFMLCLPILIPAYAIREILNFTQKLCKQFDLSVYHRSFNDVKAFDIPVIYSLFSSEQKAYLEENPNNNKVFVESDKLTAICKYERTIDNLVECFHNEVIVNHSKPIINYNTNEFGICTLWNAGIATAFAPYFDIVLIKDEEGNEFKVRRRDFMKYMDKYLFKIDSYLPDLYVLKKKQAKSCKGVVSKLKKFAITDDDFTDLRFADLIDKY